MIPNIVPAANASSDARTAPVDRRPSAIATSTTAEITASGNTQSGHGARALPPPGDDSERNRPSAAASSAATPHSHARSRRRDVATSSASEKRRPVARIGWTTTSRPIPSAAAWQM